MKLETNVWENSRADHSAMKTHLLTDQNALTTQIIL